MTRWKAITAVVAAAFVGMAPTAGAVPLGQPVQPVPGAQALLELQVDSLEPRVVTATTENITVTGKVTNTGDRHVDDVQVRLQRGDAVTSEGELRDVQNQATDSGGSPFVEVTDRLDRGDSAPVTISVPITGEESLQLTEPGVYPLLVNVNGQPDFGGQARLAAVSIPLPVLALPGGEPATPDPTPPGFTMLWPLLDTEPRRLPTTDGQVVLDDDELADSLSVGGRLFSLVSSVLNTKSSGSTATNASLMRSLCFAVDPDLLETVAAMSHGYKVRTSNGQLVAGKGAEAATDWLVRVRDLTKGQCVFAVPYADADLVALSRAGAVDLAQLSLAGSAIVAELLEPVKPAKEIFWPAGGTFDQRTIADLGNLGPATVLAEPGSIQGPDGPAPYLLNGTQTANPIKALPVDSLVSDALASPSAPRADAGDDQEDAVQTGLAALTYRTAFAEERPDHILVAPPRRWSAPTTELTLFLEMAKRLFETGFATPSALLDSAAEEDTGTASGLGYTAEDSAEEIPASTTTEVAGHNAVIRDLLVAMHRDAASTVDPISLLAPLQNGLLRATSTAWRGDDDRAREWVDNVDAQIDGLLDLVTVTDPGRPLSLASGDSPIQVSMSNGLPVAIEVQINLNASAGLRPEQYPVFTIPPGGGITRYIPAEVVRAGRFTVDARLSTPAGTPLGETARLELNSTTYGIITVAVTGTAGGLLVLLVIVRIIRRVRAAKAGVNGEGGVDA